MKSVTSKIRLSGIKSSAFKISSYAGPSVYLAKQGSVTSGEFHSHILKIVKRCQFPNQEAEERAVRDAIFMGMNSQRARDKAINLMNEEGKEVTVESLMNRLWQLKMLTPNTSFCPRSIPVLP